MMRSQRTSTPTLAVLVLPVLMLLVSLACGLPFQTENSEPVPISTEAVDDEIRTLASATPLQAPTETPVPTATPSPTETQQAYATVSAGILKEQLFHVSFALPAEETLCQETLPAAGSPLPQIVPEGRSEMLGSRETYTFCIYGYPFDQETYLTVNAPDGTFMGDALLKVESDSLENGLRLMNDETGNWVWFGEVMIINDIPTVRLRLWMPVGLANGTWNMILFADGTSFEQTFTNPPHDHMAISTLPEGKIDLMPPYPCSSFSPGEMIYIYGAGFEPNIELPLGIYADTDTGSAVLVDSLSAPTEANGTFSVWIEVKDSYPAGYYSIVPNEAVNGNVIEQVDATGCFQVEGTTTELEPVDGGEGIWEPCIGLHVSQLHIGDHAVVNPDSNLPNRVRSAPDRYYGEHLGSLGPGEKMWIIDGPECANGWVWWKIKAEGQDLEGWTTEGDHFEYWLLPIP